MAIRNLDENGILYFWHKIKEHVRTAVSGKVDKEDGKGLTHNDLTDDLKAKYDGAYQHSEAAHAPAGAEENVIAGIKKNGAAIAPVGKVVDISVPTKVSQLQNDSSFATQAQVAEAVAAAGHLSRQIVSVLPDAATADANTIYMVPKASTQDGNSYDEYMVIKGAWERIGSSDVDLSGYLKAGDVAPITNAEIDAIVAQ